jgi:hypothetical protein
MAQPNKIRSGFISLSESLLQSISDVFPECEDSSHALELFQTLVKGDSTTEDEFIHTCHKLFKENSEGITSRDPESIFNLMSSIDILKDIDLKTKWADPDFTEESKGHFWQYLVSLDTYANLYCALPAGVMGKIESLAGDIGQRVQSGQFDLSKMDINSLGKELLGSLSSDEMRSFEGGLVNVYESVGKIASLISKQSGGGELDIDGLMARLGQLQQTPGEIDMGSLVQEIGSSIAPNLSPVLSSTVNTLMQSLSDGNGGIDLKRAQQLLNNGGAQDITQLLGIQEPKAKKKKHSKK